MLSTLLVTNPTDGPIANETSLREAIVQADTDAAAGISDTIGFDASLGSSTIDLTQGQLELSGDGEADDHHRRQQPQHTDCPQCRAGNNRLFEIDGSITRGPHKSQHGGRPGRHKSWRRHS